MNQPLSSLVRGPIQKEDLVRYAQASGDHNPIHLDDSFAQKAGFPGVIVHGMLSMAFLGDFVRHHFPEDRFQLKRLQARFKKVTFPGDTLTCEGEIKKAESTLTIAVRARSQRGEITTEGEAEVTPR